MAKFRFDVGLVIYHEVTIEADDLDSAKILLDASTVRLKNGDGMTNEINQENVFWDMSHKEIQWHGVKPNSVVKVADEILE